MICGGASTAALVVWLLSPGSVSVRFGLRFSGCGFGGGGGALHDGEACGDGCTDVDNGGISEDGALNTTSSPMPLGGPSGTLV